MTDRPAAKTPIKINTAFVLAMAAFLCTPPVGWIFFICGIAAVIRDRK